jgi:hypothetical protein
MKTLGSIAALAVASSALAGLGASTYTDATFDLFDNGFDNLDITSVAMENDASTLYISVTTRGFQNWTKYMMYFDTETTGGTSTNAWNRPVILSGASIEYYLGSWVDQPTDNSQFVAWTGAEWDWGGVTLLTNSVSGNTVTWALSLSAMGLGVGDTFYFDVATSGGGNDPGVDHLSRSTPATPGWGTASEAGPFLAYTVVPSPGAVALLGLAGLAGRRRRA